MAKALVIAVLAWPMLLSSVVWTRHHERMPLLATAVYAAASKVCHQRPDRSFFTAGVQWPVCGRCAGLYLAAPIGAVWALSRRRSRPIDIRDRAVVLASALPTLVTLASEWTRVWTPSTLTRCLAALPLGLAIAWVLVRVTQVRVN